MFWILGLLFCLSVVEKLLGTRADGAILRNVLTIIIDGSEETRKSETRSSSSHLAAAFYVCALLLDCPLMSPLSPYQIVANQPYDKAVDWWSYGVLLYEMLAGQVWLYPSSRFLHTPPPACSARAL